MVSNSSPVRFVRSAFGVGALTALILSQVASADVFNMPDSQKSLLFVPVGDVGNAANTNGRGSVNYNYQIGTYDVTVAQYTQFLNAVAWTDPYHLWNSNMGNTSTATLGQISRSGASGSYTYTFQTGHDNMPVNNISWGDAVRFANWLSNGQRATGVEDGTTTEQGSYTVNGAITDATLNNVNRNANASYVIPTRDEWYKAAYYKGNGLNAGYWLYATQNNTVPSNIMNADGLNNATYYNNGYTDPVNYFTEVGFFHLCPSPYGAFDMAGEMWQWGETRVSSTTRDVHSGSFAGGSQYLPSSRTTTDYFNDSYYDGSTGFRVAAVPEPASLALLGIGAVALLTRRHGRKG
jgi:formylglycine-generating enzyme